MPADDRVAQAEDDAQVKVYFNPFAYTIEENNEFLRLGYEPLLTEAGRG